MWQSKAQDGGNFRILEETQMPDDTTNRPDPLTELYTVGYFVETIARNLSAQDASHLRESVSEIVQHALDEAMDFAIKAYEPTSGPVGLGMDGAENPFSALPGDAPLISISCVARCKVEGCGHEVAVFDSRFLTECRCPKHKGPLTLDRRQRSIKRIK
jgi:hypothetical protein